MIIKGIQHNAYMLHNPIWVDVSGLNNPLNMNINISGKSYSFTSSPYKGAVRFDLAEIVLGLIGFVQNKKSIVYTGTSWVVDGAYSISFNLSSGSSSESFTKVFVLGGIDEYASNVPVPNSLSINNNKWENYPAFDFKLVGGSIRGTALSAINKYIRVKCDNAYIIFRNRLGGFTSYLFEDFEIKDNGVGGATYITDSNIIVQSSNFTKSIKLSTKLKREDYVVGQHLINSDEVYLYTNQGDLTRLSGSNNITINNKLSVQDFSVSFNIAENYKQ